MVRAKFKNRRHVYYDGYRCTGNFIDGNILSYFFNDALLDLSTPDEYESAETLSGKVYRAGKDLNSTQFCKKIKEMGDKVLIMMYDKELKSNWEYKLKKEQLAALRKFRKK